MRPVPALRAARRDWHRCAIVCSWRVPQQPGCHTDCRAQHRATCAFTARHVPVRAQNAVKILRARAVIPLRFADTFRTVCAPVLVSHAPPPVQSASADADDGCTAFAVSLLSCPSLRLKITLCRSILISYHNLSCSPTSLSACFSPRVHAATVTPDLDSTFWLARAHPYL